MPPADPPPLAGRPPALPKGMRIYAVGDVHGRDDLLAQMHAMIDADAAHAGGLQVAEVMLGDYIDRGPDSRAVVERLLDRKRIRHVTTLRGNHESFLLAAEREPRTFANWLENGGCDTLRSYGVDPDGADAAARFYDALPPAHLAFYRRTTLSLRCEDYLFVHAGIRPGRPLSAQSEHDLIWIRDAFLDSDADHGVCVVHGHTPGPTPVVRPNRIGIDTKASESGILTCLVLEGTERRFLATG
jgi:serine/threonine protein phosphatase 1